MDNFNPCLRCSTLVLTSSAEAPFLGQGSQRFGQSALFVAQRLSRVVCYGRQFHNKNSERSLSPFAWRIALMNFDVKASAEKQTKTIRAFGCSSGHNVEQSNFFAFHCSAFKSGPTAQTH